MTEFLLRTFVKNHQDVSNPEVHSKIGKLAGIVGIVSNFLLSGSKMIVGFLVGSISITADGLNNLSDSVSSLITLLGFHIARQPADKEHPYGHARFEYMSGLMISVLILTMGIELAKSSLSKILHPAPISSEFFALLILILSLCVKIWLYCFNRTLGTRIQSTTLLVAATDSRNDVIATSAVLLGYLINQFTGINLDGYIGLAVAIFILCSGIQVTRETVTLLLGKAADKELAKEINSRILSHEKVLGIHDLLIHDYGPGKCYASVHVELSADESPLDCHDLLDHIEQEIAEQFNIHLVIHYDPVITNDDEGNKLRSAITAILAEMNPAFSMHDFRLIRQADEIKILFDLVVPHSMNQQHHKLKAKIDETLKHSGIPYPTDIRFDVKMY